MGFPASKGTEWLTPAPWAAAARTVFLFEPNDMAHHAGGTNTSGCGVHFTYGVGGPCDRYDPPGGYLCSANASGGGFGWDTMVPGAPLFPTALRVPTSAWTQAGVVDPSQWQTSTQTGAKPIIQTWTNGWCTTFWEVDNITSNDNDTSASTNAANVMGFGRGGQQTGRGFHTSKL
eukprot:m.29155 g.29155  ORF g.29155 m.29155 type:complete len:175 (+) comp13685_c0_seq1:224-748(+)